MCQTEYATPHDWKRDDQMRALVNPTGREQAENARRWFLDGADTESTLKAAALDLARLPALFCCTPTTTLNVLH